MSLKQRYNGALHFQGVTRFYKLAHT